MIGGSPVVRSEYALDMLLSDIVVQAGYAFAACDKATPGLILLDPSRSMEEWADGYPGKAHQSDFQLGMSREAAAVRGRNPDCMILSRNSHLRLS